MGVTGVMGSAPVWVCVQAGVYVHAGAHPGARPYAHATHHTHHTHHK